MDQMETLDCERGAMWAGRDKNVSARRMKPFLPKTGDVMSVIAI
jgi:hypothetical protein